MADENHARAFGAQSPEHFEDLVRLLRRQHGGRFVENEDPRVPVDRLQDLDALLLTNRQLIDAARRIDVESKLSGQQVDPLRGLPEVQKLAPANDLVPEHHVLRDGEDWDEHEVLVDHADPASDRVGGIADRDRLAVHTDLAGVRRDESVEDVHERGLPGAATLEVSRLRAKDDRGHEAVRGLDLVVRAGEIVGVAGVAGNGQDEIVESLMGLRRPTAGTIRLGSLDLTRATVDQRRDRGMSFVPADRHRFGLVLTYPIDDNLALTRYADPPFSGGFAGIVRNFRAIAENALRLMKEFDIRASGPKALAGTLSGGNQQKVIVAREFGQDVKLLVLDQPTRGLDVGSIEFIHKQVIARRDRGAAVLLVSAELDEVLELSDRILVVFRGNVVGTFAAEEAQREKIGLLMATGAARA